MNDWSDLRLFLAMSKHGSLSAAARAVKVSQPTLSRRLNALEEGLGTELFVRSVDGLLLTPTGERLVEHAQRMQEEATNIERIAAGDDDKLVGTVTITTIESIGAGWLTKKLLPFQDLYPEVTLELEISSNTADLLRREADIAIRMYRPTEPDLIAKKLADMSYGFYATKAYISSHGQPKYLRDLENHKMVLPNGSIIDYLEPLLAKRKVRLGEPAFRSSSMSALTTATLAGYGIGIHSSFTANQHPELVRVYDETIEVEVWLVTHKDVKTNARIRAVFDFITDIFKRDGAVFKDEA